jgi:hypothetical protein
MEKNNGGRIPSSFGLWGGRRISFSRISFGLLLLKLCAMIFNSTSTPFLTAPLLPQPLLTPPNCTKSSHADTLLIPSYGEKVKPELAERLISEHPDVRGVLAFGEGEVGIGVVAELRGRGVVGGSHPHLNKKGEAGELEDGIPNTSRAHRVHVRGAQAAGEDG